KSLGNKDSNIAPRVLFYKINHKIEPGICATAGIDATVFGHYFVVHKLCFGKCISEFIGKTPVRSALPTIQQSCFCKKKSGNTKAGYFRSETVLLYNPGHKRSIT